MELRPYTGSTAPTQTPALRPKLMTWTSRVWRESPDRTIPLFKIDARLEPRAAPNGAVHLGLMQSAGAATDIVISVVPMRVEAHRLLFAVSTYDFGIHARIS
jgi:hypothetical protein